MKSRWDIAQSNREENMKTKMFTDAESEMYFCAFRYCLGRKSYVVADFCEEATRKIKQIIDSDLVLIEKELLEAIHKDNEQRAKGERDKTLGWDCDRAKWVRFAEIVSVEIDRRGLEHRIPQDAEFDITTGKTEN